MCVIKRRTFFRDNEISNPIFSSTLKNLRIYVLQILDEREINHSPREKKMNREKYFSLPTKIYLRPFVVAFNLCIASRSKNSPISPITISNRCTVSICRSR